MRLIVPQLVRPHDAEMAEGFRVLRRDQQRLHDCRFGFPDPSLFQMAHPEDVGGVNSALVQRLCPEQLPFGLTEPFRSVMRQAGPQSGLRFPGALPDAVLPEGNGAAPQGVPLVGRGEEGNDDEDLQKRPRPLYLPVRSWCGVNEGNAAA